MPQSPAPTHSFGPPSRTGHDRRRQQPRNALHCPVTIAIAGGGERAGTTVDLSRDGLSLSTDRPISPGSRCMLYLHVADASRQLRFEVKSVYSSYAAPGDFRIGVVFMEPDREAQDQLRALVAQG